MKFLKKSLIVISPIFLIVLCTPFFGYLYKIISGERDYGGFFIWSLEHPEYFGGFFMAYAFFLTLFFTLFGGKRKYIFLAIMLGLEFLFFYDAGTTLLIILLYPAIIAWLIAQAILIIKKKISKK
jgi:hypothetical protein